MFGFNPIKQRCSAEIGRPGSFHGCRRLAKWRCWSLGTWLYYCGKHENRAYPNNGKYNSVKYEDVPERIED